MWAREFVGGMTCVSEVVVSFDDESLWVSEFVGERGCWVSEFVGGMTVSFYNDALLHCSARF